MDNEQNLSEKINELTTDIIQNYPELTKFLDEMPVNNHENLQEYYDSLKAMVDNYEESQETKD